jgi:uncharacterized membrane protein
MALAIWAQISYMVAHRHFSIRAARDCLRRCRISKLSAPEE